VEHVVKIRQPLGHVVRVGHKGAAALAPENSLEALRSGIEHGVDLVEFDVVERSDGVLVLAHSPGEIIAGSPTLADALDLVARAARQVGIDLDLKLPGYEDRALTMVGDHDLLDRTLVCSLFPGSLRTARRLHPGSTLGLSYPLDRHGVGERPWARPAVAIGVAALRAALPRRIVRLVRAATADVAVLHYSVISRETVVRCHRADIPVLAWTVDHADVLRAVVAAGVDGVITNNPLILHAA